MNNLPQKIAGEVKISPAIVEEVQAKIESLVDFKQKIEGSLTKSASEITEIILAGGIILDASDIHIEPQKEVAKMRLRLDGILQDVLSLDLKIYNLLLSRIKLLAGLKLNVFNRPQDGRFSTRIEDRDIDFRISTFPTTLGEKIAIRVLDPKMGLKKFEELG